ncbi:MAG: hypothetical protein KDJ72_13065 [Methyloceanibacter sp.]|nr:hypothetical protein [Methyloceanibacter sp.]
MLLISDPDHGVGPEFIEGQLILSTPSRILCGCLMSDDGDTEVTLGPVTEVDPGALPTFDAKLETPHHRVDVWTVEDQTILSAKVPGDETRVRIWVNHPTEPDVVIIGLG